MWSFSVKHFLKLSKSNIGAIPRQTSAVGSKQGFLNPPKPRRSWVSVGAKGVAVARKKREASPRPLVSPVGGVYTSEEAAELLRTSKRTVQRLIREGKLRSHRLGHGYRILDRDIQAFFADQEPQGLPTGLAQPITHVARL
jgi:excisionase family DNA binding protein